MTVTLGGAGGVRRGKAAGAMARADYGATRTLPTRQQLERFMAVRGRRGIEAKIAAEPGGRRDLRTSIGARLPTWTEP